MREGLDSVNQCVAIHESALQVVNFQVIIEKIETYIFICFKKAILVKNTVGEDTIHRVKQNLLWFGNGISVFTSKIFNPDV